MTKVLIVDDKSENLSSLSALLIKNGFTVDEASHGAEALIRAHEDLPDLIISDLFMPVMDGYSLLKQCKFDDKLRKIPFVVYTATYTDPKDELLAFSLGANEFIIKPEDPDRFIELIKEILDREISDKSLENQAKGDDKQIFKEYNEVLIRKLEEKAYQLSESNKALKEDIEKRMHAEEEALRQRVEAEKSRLALLSILEDQKETENELRDSEEMLRLSTELGGVAVWEYNFIVNEMSRSKNHDKLYGLEWQTKWDINTFLNATHPDDRALSSQTIQKSVAAGGPDRYEFDFRVVYPNNEIHWLRVIGEVVNRNGEGNATLIRGTLIDITKSKVDELAIRKSETKFSALFQNISVPVALVSNQNYAVVDVNKAWLNLLGYEKNEVIGKTSLEIGITRDTEKREEVINEVKSKGIIEDHEYILFKKSGEKIIVLLNSDQVEINGKLLIINSIYDITESKRTQERFIKIFHNNPFPINLFDLSTGRSVDVNDAYINFTGYSRDEIIGHTADELNFFVDREQRLKWIEQMRLYGSVREKEFKFRLKSGEIKDVSGSIEMIDLNNKKHGLVMLIDITEKKIAEKVLENSEKKYKALVEQSITGIYIFDKEKFYYVNKRFCEIFGYTDTEIYTGIKATDLVVAQDVDKTIDKIDDRLERNIDNVHYIARGIHKSGKEIWVEAHGTYIILDNKKVITGTLLDITERKNAEKILQNSERKFKALIEQSITGIYIFDKEKFIYVNKRFCEIFGYNEEEIYNNLKPTDVVMANEVNRAQQKIDARLEGKVDAVHYIAKGKHKYDKELWIEIHGTHIMLDNNDVITGTVLDITERKISEELQRANENKIQSSEKQYRALFDYAPDGILIADTSSYYLDANPAMCSLLGLTREEIVGLHARDIVIPSEVEHIDPALEKITSGNEYSREWQFRRKDGSVFSAEVIVTTLPEGNLLAVVRDITEKKSVDMQLRRWGHIFEYAEWGIAVTTSDGNRISLVNPAFAKMHGYSLEELENINIFDLYSPEVHEELRNHLIQIEAKGRHIFESVHLRKDRSRFPVLIDTSIARDENGKMMYRSINVIDITERKEDEQKLKLSENRHRLMFDHMMEGMAYHKVYFEDDIAVDYEYLQVNEAFEHLTGLKDVVGKKVSELMPGIGESNPELLQRFGRVAKTGKPEQYESYIKSQNQWYFTSLYALDKDIVVSVFDNITIKKIAEEKIKESEKKYRELFSRMSQGVTYLDTESNIIDANPAAIKILGMTPEIIKEKSSANYAWNTIERDGTDFPFENFPAVIARKTGKRITNVTMGVYNQFIKDYRWIKIDAIPQPNINNKPPFEVVATIEDITDSVQADIELELANTKLRNLYGNLDRLREEERKKVARELHDELGQVITSIKMNLSLLQNSVKKDKYDKDRFIQDIDEMQEIVDNSKSNIKNLIRYLRPEFLDSLGLIIALNHLVEQSEKQSGIKFNFDHNIEDHDLNPQIENTVFRIIQETVTNILKYSKASEVWVELIKEKALLNVRIEDNGIGIRPEDLKKSASLGIVGIRERLKIIGSELVIDSKIGKGTKLQFSINL